MDVEHGDNMNLQSVQFSASDSGEFIIDALDAIRLHFAYNEDEFNTGSCITFFPKMAHQIFGTNELIFGYSDLRIHITYSASSAHAFFRYTYSRKLKDSGLLVPDNIKEKLSDWFPKLYDSSKEFASLLRKQTRCPIFGTCLNKFSVCDKLRPRRFSVNICDLKQQRFVKFHERFQSLIVFYIDAASYIDMTDLNWSILYLYQEKEIDDKTSSFPIGFLTIYKFTTPKLTRSRISQVFILPPFQRLGLGTKLLETAYGYINTMGNIYEITVESPSPEFTILRDNYDLKLVTALPEFSRTNILKGFTADMSAAALKVYKINSLQCRHLYNLLICYHTPKQSKYDDDLFYKTLRKRFKASHKKRCKRNLSKSINSNYLVNILKEEYDDKEEVQKFLENIKPSLNFLENIFKK